MRLSSVTMQVLALFVVLVCYRSVASNTIVVPSTTEESHVESQETNKTVEKVKITYSQLRNPLFLPPTYSNDILIRGV